MTKCSRSFDRLDQAQMLLEEWSERRGEVEEVPLEELIASHPDLEAELRELAAACEEVEAGFSDEARRAARSQEELELLLRQVSLPKAFSERYAIESEIGKGGMGAVYRIVDTHLSRPLAMKVILGQAEVHRTGNTPPVSPRQLSRFLNEAKITSQLDHPGIVPVHEVGVDEEGRAYFTMKLVQGRTLAEVFEFHARGDADWSTPRVLGVIQRVCEALAFAHERAVIHRDLKPANVMVGDFGEVYVMDWGLARRLGQEESGTEEQSSIDEDLTREISLTREGRVLGTPCYMSPEQARGEISQMSPQSDVYAIGAMLYQLVAGSPPYLRQGERASSGEILARIEAGPPGRLESRKRAPELVAIIERAMSYERSSRYATVRELAEDLERFVSGRTVKAFRTGAWVELEKWVRRNKALSGALAAGLLAIVGGAIAFAVESEEAQSQKQLAAEQAARAERHAEQARASEAEARASEAEARARERQATNVTEFVQRALTNSDPMQGGVQKLTVEDAMKRAVLDLDRGELRDDPQTEAALQTTIARILNGNSNSNEGLRLAEQALATQQRLHAGDHTAVAHALSEVAACLQSLDRNAEALPKFEAALAMLERLGEGDDPDVARALANVANCLQDRGRYADAWPRFEAALEMQGRLFHGDHPDVASGLNYLGRCLDLLHRSSDALPMLEAALKMREKLYGADNIDVAVSLNNVASCLESLDRHADALPKYEAALAMRMRLFEGDHPYVARGLNNVAYCLSHLGRNDEALPKHEAALAMRQRLFHDDHTDVAMSLNNVGLCLCSLNRFLEGLPKLEAALAMQERLNGGDHPLVARCLENVAGCLDQLGRNDEALSKHEAALAMRQRLFQADHSDIVLSLNNLGYCLIALGRVAEALEKQEAALAMQERLNPEGHPDTAAVRAGIARSLHLLGRNTEAEQEAQRAVALAERFLPDGHPTKLGCRWILEETRRALAAGDDQSSPESDR